MAVDDASGAIWRERVIKLGASDDSAREALGKIIADDHTPDPFEVLVYETDSDPDYRRLDKAQRSYAGQYERRLKRLRQRERHTATDPEQPT